MTETEIKDRMTGCWMGKNSGGTLGGPLEQGYGQKEMFSIDWYPSLPEGGIPNDDLEMQLVWLQTLERKGPDLTEKDLVQAWLDCIKYNFDEYGFAKVNMQKGLLPPVCSWYDNPFKDCMGSPIRSELWACVAMGHPKIAAHYAFLDAICDHGGGESVFGEVFNAVMQSMAFFLDDPLDLIGIGLKAIPEKCTTASCIRMAVKLHETGKSYVDARNALWEAFYDPNAQYAPLNLGFQTIGLLYGSNFGDAMCKAVNCGYDTDCTGATVGATLGIILGYKGLPKRWIEPLGKNITVNVSTGGIANLEIPTELDQLTERTYRQAKRVLAHWGYDDPTTVTKEMALDNARGLDASWLEEYRSDTVSYSFGGMREEITYIDDAAIIEGRPSKVFLSLTNVSASDLNLSATFHGPEGFVCEGNLPRTVAKPGERITTELRISADARCIEQSNVGYVQVACENRPAIPALPLVLCGGRRFFRSPLFSGKRLEDGTALSETEIHTSLPPSFSEHWTVDNDLHVEGNEPGVLYLLHDLFSERERDVYIGVPTDGRSALFLNGTFLHKTEKDVPLRPNLGGTGEGDGANYVKTSLASGWNRLLIKLEIRSPETKAFLTLGSVDARYPLRNCGYVDGLNETRTRMSIGKAE